MRKSSRLVVHLDRLAHNFNELKNLCPNNEVIFMVKANGYGHGMEEVSKFAFDQGLCKEFGVASFLEAKALRAVLPEALIYVFSDLNLETEIDQYKELNLTPVIACYEDLDVLLNSEYKNSLPVVLKIDTGMNRIGIQFNTDDLLIEKLTSAGIKKIDHLMTHFSCSYYNLKAHKRTEKQYQRFNEVREKLNENGFEIISSSVSNSGAIEQGFGLGETHVRPGLMMYGPTSLNFKVESPWKGVGVSTLESEIIKVFAPEKGMPIGYGGTVCNKSGTIIVLPIGYGDGFLTQYKDLEIVHGNLKGQVFGRVNMDMISVLFPDVTPDKFKMGETVKIWDDAKKVDHIALHAESIPYAVFCALTSRIPRLHRLE